MKFYNIILFLVFIVVVDVSGQATRLHTSNQNAWLMYFGNHKISDRFGIHAEVQLRRHDLFSDDQQLLLRTGIDYYLKDNSRFTVGYAFIRTYPYGNFAVANAFPEHRIWEQFLTTQTFGKLKLSHRYRLEQRMIGNAATGEYKNGRYENRFRYMAKVTRNLFEGKHPLFVAAYDELFVNFGKDVAYNLFDQNRAYGAVGYVISPVVKIEIGYLYQLVQLRSLDATTPVSRNKIEDNHTLQIGVFSNMAFFKKDQ